jgi:hypothetical protein
MKYDSDNFTMSFLYGIAGLLSASHLLAHLPVDKTKKHLGLCSPNQAGVYRFGSKSSSLPNLAKFIRIFDSRQSFSDYSCHPINTCLPLMLSLLFVYKRASVCKRASVYKRASLTFILLREVRFNMSRHLLFHKALWPIPLLRQSHSATYVKLLARSVHTEQLPPTTPVRPVCLSSRIKDIC